MVEVLTHEAPYQDLLDFLEVDDILAAITGRKKITAQLPQVRIHGGEVFMPLQKKLFLNHLVKNLKIIASTIVC